MIRKLKTDAAEDFDFIYQLLAISLPDDEYRTYEEQKKLLKDPAYSIYYSKKDAKSMVESFLAVWDFANFAFIEHFVVNPTCRNSGLGSQMLKNMTAHLNKKICLEVELPNDELSSRRIGFYERNKFCLNKYPYLQPAMSAGKNTIPLYIMTYGHQLDQDGFLEIKETLYKEVYKCKI